MTALRRNPRLDGARVGMIVPSVNATIEPEFAWIAPPGLSFHVARIMLQETTADGLRAMNAGIGSAARLLASLAPRAVAYACTGGSFLDGAAGLQASIDAIAAIVGCPVVATSGALVDALRALGVKRLALATPYLDPVNRLERAFLEQHAIEVVAMRGLGLSGAAIRDVPPERVFQLACDTDTADAEALFLSCTDLRALGRRPDIAGFGRLLRE